MNKFKTILGLGLLAACTAAAQSASAALAINFETNAVRITGSTRGGRVVCAFVDRAPHNTLSGSTVIADTDNDGEVRVALPQTLDDRTVWVAVDLETGDYTAATPQGIVSNITFHGHSFRANNGELKQLASNDFERLDVLLVRPRGGAWALHGGDGGPGDADGRVDHTFLLDVDSLKPILSDFGPPPKKFDKGDVVVLIDPGTSDVYIAEVGK